MKELKLDTFMRDYIFSRAPSWEEAVEELVNTCIAARAERDALKARIEKLRGALEFYAMVLNWSDNRNIYYYDTASPVDMDLQDTIDGKNNVAGKRARAALAADDAAKAPKEI